MKLYMTVLYIYLILYFTMSDVRARTRKQRSVCNYACNETDIVKTII